PAYTSPPRLPAPMTAKVTGSATGTPPPPAWALPGRSGGIGLGIQPGGEAGQPLLQGDLGRIAQLRPGAGEVSPGAGHIPHLFGQPLDLGLKAQSSRQLLHQGVQPDGPVAAQIEDPVGRL